MDESELNSMLETGKVQQSFSGTTHVASPAAPLAFIKQADIKKGQTFYVEFEVPSSSLTQTSEGWASINGPRSAQGRLAAYRGLPIPQMPEAKSIIHKATKIR